MCYWNLNSISALNFVELCHLKAYIELHNFDIICFSETHTDSNTPSDNDNLETSGYNLIGIDYSSNNKHGGTKIFKFAIYSS